MLRVNPDLKSLIESVELDESGDETLKMIVTAMSDVRRWGSASSLLASPSLSLSLALSVCLKKSCDHPAQAYSTDLRKDYKKIFGEDHKPAVEAVEATEAVRAVEAAGTAEARHRQA